VTLAANIGPRNIAVDGQHVYWLEPSTARAMQADLDGTNQVQLGGGTSNYLLGLGTDDASVYWGSAATTASSAASPRRAGWSRP
jgi:hypothetical protein